MSTNINISVGDNKLLDQARLQQNASRQAQLEKEANKRLSNEAEINRVNALAAQGKDANGNTITAPGTAPKPLRDEPAAIRTATDDYLMLLPSGGVQTGIPFPLSTYLDAEGQWTPTWGQLSGANNIVYQQQGGPSGAPALSTGQDGTTTNNFVGGTAKFFPADSKVKYRTQLLKNFTIEFFLRLPSYPNTTYNYDLVQIYCSNSTNTNGLLNTEIEIVREINPSDIDFRTVRVYVKGPDYPPGASPTGNSSGPEVFNCAYNLDPDRVPVSEGYVDGSLSPIVDLQWQHFALVSKQVPGTAPQSLRQKLSFYINGVQYSGRNGSPSANSVYWEPTNGVSGYQFSSVENEESISFSVGGLNLGGIFTGPIKLHGLKLTPKALYDGNFTPPSRIRT